MNLPAVGRIKASAMEVKRRAVSFMLNNSYWTTDTAKLKPPIFYTKCRKNCMHAEQTLINVSIASRQSNALGRRPDEVINNFFIHSLFMP